jgi:hypothetical protein
MSQLPAGAERVTYKFDLIAVATVDITTAYGEPAARQAAGSIEVFDPIGAPDADPDAPDVAFDLRAVAPYGRAYLAETDPALPDVTIDPPVPVTQGHGLDLLTRADIEAMHAALAALDGAADGSLSPDEEHAAAADVARHLARLLTLLGYPPGA